MVGVAVEEDDDVLFRSNAEDSTWLVKMLVSRVGGGSFAVTEGTN